MIKFKHLGGTIIGLKPERFPSKKVSTFLSFLKTPFCVHLYHTNYTASHTHKPHILSIPGHLEMYLDITSEHTQLPELVFSGNKMTFSLLLNSNLKKGVCSKFRVLSTRYTDKDPCTGRTQLP